MNKREVYQRRFKETYDGDVFFKNILKKGKKVRSNAKPIDTVYQDEEISVEQTTEEDVYYVTEFDGHSWEFVGYYQY